MKRVTRDGWSLALLWLACGNGIIAQGVSKGTNEQDSSSTNITINHSNTTKVVSSITSTTIVNATTSITPSAPGYPATCRSGTVNHITHSLPQQCPTSAWTAPSAQTTVSIDSSLNATGSVETSHTISSVSNSIDTSPSAESTQLANATTTIVESPEPTARSVDKSETVELDSSAVSPTPSSSSSPSPSPISSPSATVLEATSIDPDPELETDSPLDNVNFLSFEEWKKQNLEKAGQSPDGGQNVDGQARQRPEIALDALGDEGEISLDFTGFGSARIQHEEKSPPEEHPKVTKNGVASNGPVLRSKDAGKTCKERSNYASFDCAATILKTNPETKSSSAILIENKDSYMLNPCSVGNKFIIVELCDDILIDTIVLANYEFFSSIFRTFRVSVSDRYPVKADKWKELGVFEASNSRSVQAFLVPHSLIWARYLRIEFLTHFGTEYYCPVSLLRVHGTTMMEEFRHQEYINRGENLDDSEDEAVPLNDEKINEPGPIAQEPPAASIEADKSVVEESVLPSAISVEAATDIDLKVSGPAPPATASHEIETDSSRASESTGESTTIETQASAISSSVVSPIPTESAKQETQTEHFSITETTSSITSSAPTTPSNLSHSNSTTIPGATLTDLNTAAIDDSRNATTSEDVIPVTKDQTLTSTHPVESSAPSTSKSSAASSSSPSPIPDSKASDVHISKASTSISSSTASSNSTISVQPSSSVAQNTTSSTQSHAKSSSSSSSTLSATPSNPTTQESFFKSLHKRLQTLESNASLSLQYIESQSLLLRTAFAAVEKRQLKKTETFLANLNATVSTELDKFKGDYERLWEGVVIEMENQRRSAEREVLMVSERLTLMAEELVWQKRVGVVQTTLLMLCLGLVIFARSGLSANATGLEVPLLLRELGASKWGSRGFYPQHWADGVMSAPGSPSPTSPVAEDGEVLGERSPDSGNEDWETGRRRRSFGDRDAGGRNGDTVSESTHSRPTTRDGSATASRRGSRRTSHPNTPQTGVVDLPNGDQPIHNEQSTDTDDDRDLPPPTRSVQTIEEGDEEGLLGEEEELLNDQERLERDGEEEDADEVVRILETRSSPSTPGGTRDPQGFLLGAREEAMPIWPSIDEAGTEQGVGRSGGL